MIFSSKNIIFYILIIISIIIIFSILRTYLLIRKSKILVSEAVRFEIIIPNSNMKILVLGDSTAYGTGSETSEMSTAGRLGKLYPQASITNLAVNGLKINGLLQIIDTLNSKEHYSIILVQIGANDIIRNTNMEDVKTDSEIMFSKLSKQTDSLIVLHSGDIGKSKFFPFYLEPILTKRSLELREIYKDLANKYNAKYVNLIDDSVEKVLASDIDKYYAADKLHLTGDGYGVWFDEIKKVLP